MKKVLSFFVSVFLWAAPVNAGLSCHTDFWGNTVCNGTGRHYGYRSFTTTDYWGNHVTTNNRGNRQSCRTDFFGNYVCN